MLIFRILQHLVRHRWDFFIVIFVFPVILFFFLPWLTCRRRQSYVASVSVLYNLTCCWCQPHRTHKHTFEKWCSWLVAGPVAVVTAGWGHRPLQLQSWDSSQHTPQPPPLSLFFWRFFFSSFLTSSSPVSFFLPVTVPHLATREGRAREERQTKNFSHYCLLNEQKCLENWGPILSEQLPLFLTIVFAAVQQFFCLFFIIIFCCWSECFFFLLTVKSWLSLCCSQKTSSWPVRWREHRWNWQTLVWPSRCRETSRPGLVRILLCFLLVSLINGTETERKWSECLMWCDSVDVGPGGSYQAPATEKRKWCKNKLLYSSTSVCYSWSWYFFSLNTLI